MSPKRPEKTVAELEARIALIVRAEMAARKAADLKDVRQKRRVKETQPPPPTRPLCQVAAKEQKRETRRNILAGGWVRKMADDDPRIRTWLADGLADSLTRPRERELFDLDPMPEE